MSEKHWVQETEEFVAIHGEDIQFINVSGIFHSALPTATRSDFMPAETRFALSQWGTEVINALKKEASKAKTPTVFFKIDAKWFLEDEIPRDVELSYQIIDGMSLVDASPVD